MELTRNRQTVKASDTDSIVGSSLPSVMHEDHYWPAEPTSLDDTGLSEPLLEAIISQILLASGTLSGRRVAEMIGLPFGIIDEKLAGLRTRQIVAHARSAPLNDYYYSLTEAGQQRTLNGQKAFKYTGPAPVPMTEYLLSVEAQANQYSPVERDQLIEALSDISYDDSWLDFIGPAVNSNGGIFLHGPPGNGKTTLAKCLTILRGESIWIPHAIIDDGMIIKLYDSAYHTPTKSAHESSLVDLENYDKRWIRVERPTVVAGGELTLENLEIRHDPRSNTCEAPLQLKSNCGSLLIDDFGRQRVSPTELLNRWIVPLENKIDFLTLPTGKKISVPFEQIVLFSTNLQPSDLVDEAFMRRVPFKIEIRDPSPKEFMHLFKIACDAMGFPWRPEVVKQLIEGFFIAQNRPLRRCYPRDLLKQVRAYCTYRSEPYDLRIDYLRHACRNYFGSLSSDSAASNRVSATGASAPVPQPSPALRTQNAPISQQRIPQPLPSVQRPGQGQPQATYNVEPTQPVPAQGTPVEATQPVHAQPVEATQQIPAHDTTTAPATTTKSGQPRSSELYRQNLAQEDLAEPATPEATQQMAT